MVVSGPATMVEELRGLLLALPSQRDPHWQGWRAGSRTEGDGQLPAVSGAWAAQGVGQVEQLGQFLGRWAPWAV